MTQTRDVVILSGARTAIGDYGGSLKDVPAIDLGALVIKEAISRAGIEATEVQHTVLGNVIHGEPRDMYISRVAAVKAGVPVEAPAMTLNRLCGSGVQAIVSAAQTIMLGDADIAVAGGAESMSRSAYMVPAARWGQKMGNVSMVDSMVGALTDPFGHGHMGITAENVADRLGISREEQDAFAVESHRRAAAAIDAGYFKDQIVPVEIAGRKGTVVFDTDEHVRRDASIEGMAKLKTVFKKDGSVTAGNASGINDGAAALVLMEAAAAEARGLKPMGRIVSYGHAGVAPEVMGLGPIHAVPVALKKAGLTVDDLDVIESNEAFAAQACAVSKELGLSAAKVNPNGGAVALGHPVGATGAIITVKALYELHRTGGRYGLVTMCIGGGQGIALVVERL
ncbi:acetyl-CoA C-acyltransferase family protein [Caenispirillum bisanense]|uniref:3-ketoacyl-CoA thiolase n=1 Tax=Caenispirillum bisanense TaxID=414052 RepID=A0A286GXF7_9PROT|nr:acetyl-CoA C-acyltransferase family protein [Caenispirillum bisanense]SOD99856.1 3-ketoacyl-CoA thiolase [Caenispirillum bisanense]